MGHLHDANVLLGDEDVHVGHAAGRRIFRREAERDSIRRRHLESDLFQDASEGDGRR